MDQGRSLIGRNQPVEDFQTQQQHSDWLSKLLNKMLRSHWSKITVVNKQAHWKSEIFLPKNKSGNAAQRKDQRLSLHIAVTLERYGKVLKTK